MTMTTHDESLPEINTWWPYLTAAARNDVLEDLEAPLSERVVREIALITAQKATPGARLSDTDRQFVRHQTEIVD